MVILNSNILTAPGVYVSENTAGIVPLELASFNRCYMLGTAATGVYNEPYQIVSAEDFSNVFGSSTSLNSVTLFFRNHPNGVLFFVRAAAPQLAELTISAATVGTWSISIVIGVATPVVVTYVYADVSPTAQELIDGFVAAINSSAVATSVTAFDPQPADMKFRIKGNAEEVVFTLSAPTAPVSATLTKTDDISSVKGDFIWACENAFDPDMHAQGILIAPQAFQSIALQADRIAVGTAMENLCSTEGFDWLTFIDNGSTILTNAQADAEGDLYVTARGHLAYFYPYVSMIDAGSLPVLVPSSAGIAGMGLLKMGREGFNQPPAGVPYPLKGVTDVAVRVKRQQQAVLNPQGINVIRYLPNKGVVVYGSRTRSVNPYYRFITTRIILNVLIGTLRNAFDNFIFSGVDGRGIFRTRVRETAEAVCFRLWDGGALYGASPSQAFFVKCDAENNPDLDLEAGIVRLDVYVVPAPIAERILISVTRVAIGQIEIVTRSVGG